MGSKGWLEQDLKATSARQKTYLRLAYFSGKVNIKSSIRLKSQTGRDILLKNVLGYQRAMGVSKRVTRDEF